MSQKELAALVATRTSRKRTISSTSFSISTRTDPKSIIEIHIFNDSLPIKRACCEVENPTLKAEQRVQQEEESLGQVPPLTEEEQQRHDEFRNSGSIFLQDLPCFKLQQAQPIAGSSPIPKCRECRRRNLATTEGEPSFQLATFTAGSTSSDAFSSMRMESCAWLASQIPTASPHQRTSPFGSRIKIHRRPAVTWIYRFAGTSYSMPATSSAIFGTRKQRL